LQNFRGRFESLSVRQGNFEFAQISHPEALEGYLMKEFCNLLSGTRMFKQELPAGRTKKKGRLFGGPP
jgi:hypothetical protein